MIYKVQGKVRLERDCPHCNGEGIEETEREATFEVRVQGAASAPEVAAMAEAAAQFKDGWEFQDWIGTPEVTELTPAEVMRRNGERGLFDEVE